MIYTGPVDSYFDYCYGKLPYRSLEFIHETHDTSTYQAAPVVNYPNDQLYTRVTEFKYLTGQETRRQVLFMSFLKRMVMPITPFRAKRTRNFMRNTEHWQTEYRYIRMHLIRLLLPLHDNNKQEFPTAYFLKVREETNRSLRRSDRLRSFSRGRVVERCYKVSRDEMVMFEVMSNQLDKEWWSNYRTQLEKEFRQEELLIWASDVTKL
jgi:hypothetical protein